MKKLLAGVVMLGLTFAVGCENKSNPGGPGAQGDRSVVKADTFKLSAPHKVELKQGEEKEVRVKVDRGKDFKEDVTLKFEPAKGLTFKPDSITVKAGDTEAAVTVKADKDAPKGDNKVTVTGTPAKGQAASAQFDVKVDIGKTE